MKSPSSLHVFGTKYRLERPKKLLKRGVYGECDKESKTIAVDAALKGDEYWETLIHETLHAVFSEVSLDQAISAELEEVIVDTAAKTIIGNFLLRHKRKKPLANK